MALCPYLLPDGNYDEHDPCDLGTVMFQNLVDGFTSMLFKILIVDLCAFILAPPCSMLTSAVRD